MSENPEAGEGSFLENMNPDSLTTVTAQVEPALANASAGERFQFERCGYFCVDRDSTAENLVFNRTVALKDSWSKMQKSGKAN